MRIHDDSIRMSESDVVPEIPQSQQEVKSFNQNDNGRIRMDTQVGLNTPEASSFNSDSLVDHSSDVSTKVDALSLSETNEYTEFMNKLSEIESRRTGNDAIDRNKVRRPRERLFQEFFKTHKDLHSHLAIKIAAESKSFRDALLAKRVEQVIENNPFLINPHASQTKDGWTIDKALIKIREFELLLKEIQQLETPEIPLAKIKLSEHSLKRVRDMRYNLREKLREVDPEGVRQWIMVTADAEAPARIEAARNKKGEAVVAHEAQERSLSAQDGGEQQDLTTIEAISSVQKVEPHASEQEEHVSHPADTDIRHQLAQASRSNLSARLEEGPADPLSSLGDLNHNQQQSSEQVRESLQKLSASNLTARLEQGPQEPLQTVESTSVSDEGKMGEELRRRLSSVSASHLTQRLEQGPQPPLDVLPQVHPDVASHSTIEERPHPTPLTDALRARQKEGISRKREELATVVSNMWQSDNPLQVAKDARVKGNDGIAGFAASTVLNTEAQAIENARRGARTSSTTEKRAQTSKSGGFLKRLFGLRR